MSEILKARVDAYNMANACAAEIQPKLKAVFEPYIGKKIFTAAGPLLAKIKKQVDDLGLPHGVDLCVTRNVGMTYSLVYDVKACVVVNGGHAYYEHASAYVGDLDGHGALLRVSDYSPCKVRTVEEVLEARRVYVEAKRAADAAFSALHPFGEFDR